MEEVHCKLTLLTYHNGIIKGEINLVLKNFFELWMEDVNCICTLISIDGWFRVNSGWRIFIFMDEFLAK